MGLSIAPAIRFEQAFAGVRKTVEGTPEQLDKIRSGILDMSREMPIAATEIAEVAATAGQLGIATPGVLKFTETMVQLGTATNLTAEQAATSMARFTNVMRISVKEVPLLAAALVHLGNNSATTEAEILTLALRLGAAGYQLGLSGQQVLALSAAMRSLGITAEVGGSSMSRVIIDMVSAVGGGNIAKVEAFAKVIGVTREEFERMVRDRSPESAGKLLLGFVQGLQEVDAKGGNVRGVLQELGLDSIRLRQVLLGLVAGGNELSEAFALVGDEAVYGGALLTEYGRFAETTAARLEVLKGRLTALAIDIGTPLLGGLVAAFDGIGNAIIRMQDAFRPLGTELVELMRNFGEAVKTVYDILGSPVVLTAAAALGGLAVTVANLLSLFNMLGSTGILVLGLILADIALVGPISVLATSGLAGLSAGFLSMGASASIAAAGVDLFKAAVAASPLIVVVAALALFGKAMHDAGQAAEEAGNAYRDSFAKALEDSDYGRAKQSIADINSELKQLRETNSLDTAGALLSWRGFGDAIKGVGEVLTPFTENTVLNARRRIEELQQVLDETKAENLAFGMEKLSHVLGISEEAAFSAAIATGTLDGVLNDGTAGYLVARDAIKVYMVALEQAGLTQLRTAEEIAQTGLQLEDYAAAWDTTIGVVEDAARRAGISTEDLLDPEKFQESSAAMAPYIGLWSDIADAIGSSTEAVHAEIVATETLIGTQNRLAEAIKGVNAAREAAKFQVENLREATTAVVEARQAYLDGGITLEEYGKKVLDLNTAFAASGAPMEAVEEQLRRNNAEFVNTATTAGETQQAINGVLRDWVLLSSVEVADLQIKGQETLAAAQERIFSLREELRLPIIAQMAVETGRSEEQIIALLDRGNTWANALFEAKMDAETETAMEEIARIMVEAGIWDEIQAEAFLGADTTQAQEDIRLLTQDAVTFKDGIYEASITARDNVSQVLAPIESETRSFTETPWEAVLSAVDRASAVIAISQGNADRYKGGIYEGSITARDNASSVIAVPQGGADRYRAGNYNASITASDNASGVIANPQGAANAYTRGSPYNSTLGAIDNASGTIWGVVRALNSFVSKTITLNTINKTSYQTVGNNAFPAAQGAIFSGLGVKTYAGGGFENHTAQIARGRWPVRIWAEPETGGEAYIPMSPAKRDRSTAILGTVAREFGYDLVAMADGGMVHAQSMMATALAASGWRNGSTNWSRSSETVFNLDAPVQVIVQGGGQMDPQAIGIEVERRVRAALAVVARDIGNNIRGV